jgi:hypothetical protein
MLTIVVAVNAALRNLSFFMTVLYSMDFSANLINLSFWRKDLLFF